MVNGRGSGPGQQPDGSPRGYGTSAPIGPRPLWKTKESGVTLFRHPVPLVLWWGWVAFAVANFIDVAVVNGGLDVVKVTFGLLAVTGLLYACTLHSRVESDADGVTIYNPLRHHRAPWGAIQGIYLGDSVEFVLSQAPPKKTKTIYSWALYSRRRARARSQMQREFFNSVRRGQASSRTQAEAADLARQATAQLMAAELGREAVAARERGAPDGVLVSRWSWLPIVSIIVPVIALVASLQFH